MPTQATKQQIKEKVMAMEQENYDKLLLYRSDNTYHKIVGHSALIYAGYVAKRIGRRYNLRLDTDHYAKSEDGVISIVLNDELVRKFLAIGIKQDKKNEDKDIAVFKLPQAFKEKDIAQFRELLKQDERKINAVVLPKSPIPTLYVYLDDILVMVYHNAKNMPYFGKNVVGQDMMSAAVRMYECYIRYANGRIDKKRLAELLYKDAIHLKSQMKIAEALHLISGRNICRMLEIIVAVENLSRKYYQNER